MNKSRNPNKTNKSKHFISRNRSWENEHQVEKMQDKQK
jgi:hypothetical protein